MSPPGRVAFVLDVYSRMIDGWQVADRRTPASFITIVAKYEAEPGLVQYSFLAQEVFRLGRLQWVMETSSRSPSRDEGKKPPIARFGGISLKRQRRVLRDPRDADDP